MGGAQNAESVRTVDEKWTIVRRLKPQNWQTASGSVKAATQKHVLLTLHAFVGCDEVRPSVRTLMEDTDLSEKSVRRAIEALEGQGFIRRAPSYWPNGGRRNDRYFFLYDAMERAGRDGRDASAEDAEKREVIRQTPGTPEPLWADERQTPDAVSPPSHPDQGGHGHHDQGGGRPDEGGLVTVTRGTGHHDEGKRESRENTDMARPRHPHSPPVSQRLRHSHSGAASPGSGGDSGAARPKIPRALWGVTREELEDVDAIARRLRSLTKTPCPQPPLYNEHHLRELVAHAMHALRGNDPPALFAASVWDRMHGGTVRIDPQDEARALDLVKRWAASRMFAAVR